MQGAVAHRRSASYPLGPMSSQSAQHAPPAAVPPLSGTIARGALGGTLMGLANLVPGISGGTMLVVSGIFTHFVNAIADVTMLRLSRRTIITLLSVVVPAALAILILAGLVRDLVIDHRWIMYSLFIGWTLGGVPSVWAMAVADRNAPLGKVGGRKPGRRVWVGAALGLAVMIAMVSVQAGGAAAGGGEGGPGALRLFLGGVVAAAAMVLPGVSGGYLLLLLGLYVPILDAIDQVKDALRARDVSAALGTLHIIIPLGLGVVGGIAGVSHLVRWLLRRFEKLTVGVLLGLLIGAFLGLYPFQRPVPPEPGQVIKGREMTAEAIAQLKAKDWPVEYFTPGPGQVVASLVLVAGAAASTLLMARVGRRPGS